MAAWWKSLPLPLVGAAVAVFVAGVLEWRKRSSSEPGGGGWLPWPSDAPPDPFGGKPVDAYAEKETADHCAPPQEGAKLFRQWGIARWGERPGSPQNITRACTGGTDEHQEGRAWDLMITDLAHGQRIVDDLLASDAAGEPHALARRAGIMYMIFNHQMWRAYPQGGLARGEWGPYTGQSPHTDHVHISFSKAGGAGQTSLYDAIRAGLPVA